MQDRPYTEALFTTFNFDLGYFEQRVLGVVRASGAAVTVLCDAAQYNPDPQAVHAAGASYLIGVVALPAAFHPKLCVLVGPERVLVAVGSGNLTTGGWLGNDETLCVATGDAATGVPTMVGEVASWLASVTELQMSTPARAAVRRVLASIERLISTSPAVEGGPRLVTTAFRPILDQLPEAPADELALHAPFHDPSGTALGALIDRYRPRTVKIAVQPGRTVLDPAALESVAAQCSVELVWQDAGARYRHGKLLEAASPQRRWVLTGSPNLTGAALLRSVPDGGNCEVGVVSDMNRSIFPGLGEPIMAAAIPTVRIQVAPGETVNGAQPAPVLLSATFDEAAIVVELSSPAPFPILIDASEFEDQPEVTSTLGQIPPGQLVARFTPTRTFGARSRLRLRYERDGVEHRGPFHFLTDTEAVVRRIPPRRSTSVNTDMDWRTLFDDHSAWRDWLRTLDRVTREQRAVPAAGTAPHRTESPAVVSGDRNRRTFDDEEAWARYSDEAVARLGPTVAHDASSGLVFPHLARQVQPSGSSRPPRWADRFDADESDFDDVHSADDLDAAEADSEGEEHRSELPELSAAQKNHLRRWVSNEVIRAQAARPAIDRLALTRLVLLVSLARAWDEDKGWFHSLAEATANLPGDDVPARLQPEVGSLAAVCLYRLDQGASPIRTTGSGKAYADLLDDLRPHLAHADPNLITSIVRDIYGASSVSSSPRAVLDHLEAMTASSPWPEITRLIRAAHPGWSVDLERDAHLVIESRTGHPLTIAATALQQVPTGLTVAIRVIAGARLEERQYVRHENVFVAQDHLGARKVWKSYRLSNLVSPTSIASGESEARARIDPAPWDRVSSPVQVALAAAGVAP